MSHRIEIELTSTREDGTWTWRAAGARQPKGVLDGSLLPQGAKLGDVLRAEADFDVDGISVITVLPPKAERSQPELLEIIGTRRDEELVTTTLVPKGKSRDGRAKRRERRDGDRRDGRDSRDSRDGRDGERRERRRSDGPRDGRSGDAKSSEGSSDARSEERKRSRPRKQAERKPVETKPKPKRLRAAKTHRNEVLAGLPEEHKPIAEQVLRGGIPGVRQALDKQNEQNRAEGKPEVSPEPLLALADKLLPSLREAEWRDRAEAALADAEELDLKDLRSVVVGADVAARSDETRAMAEQLREALARRLEHDQAEWMAEVASMIAEGRVVRALRLSSRPPKAGAPFPPDMAAKLAEAAGTALTAETGSERYATVLDALAYSPVRQNVKATGVPAEPSDELKAAVNKLSSRLPQIAEQFGIEAS